MNYNWIDAENCHIDAYLTNKVIAQLNSIEKPIILDVGCGNGWMDKLLLEQGFEVYGIDSSESGIAIAKKDYPNNFFLVNAETGKLPEKINKIPFNVVLSTEVVEHVYSPKAYMDFITSILKPTKGYLIISTPYHGYLKNLVLALFNKMDSHYTALWEGGHIKFWSKQTIVRLLQNSGFNFLKFQGCGRIPFLWKSMLITAKIN